MAIDAKTTHNTLNIIIVGRVFTVEVHIKAMLEHKANTYSHHHCFPNIKPGKMIVILVIKAKNSMEFGLFQYDLSLNCNNTIFDSLRFIIYIIP
jgi:hypothetical protein